LTFFFHHHGTSPHRIGKCEIALAVSLHDCINRVSRADVVATGQIALGLRRDTEAIERDYLTPRQPVGEATAHSMVM
jgi:hypothetical protein